MALDFDVTVRLSLHSSTDTAIQRFALINNLLGIYHDPLLLLFSFSDSVTNILILP